jgi:hypothetical protein
MTDDKLRLYPPRISRCSAQSVIWPFVILSEPQASSEIKGNPHLLKQLLVFTEVFVT